MTVIPIDLSSFTWDSVNHVWNSPVLVLPDAVSFVSSYFGAGVVPAPGADATITILPLFGGVMANENQGFTGPVDNGFPGQSWCMPYANPSLTWRIQLSKVGWVGAAGEVASQLLHLDYRF